MRGRTLCVWFPMWSLNRPDAPPGDPLLVVDDRVVAATDEVIAAGVAPGMTRREAETLAPFATVLTRDPSEETRRFEPVVAALETVVPRVEVAAPGLAYLPVRGAVRFYGSEEAVAAEIIVTLGELMGAARGGGFRVGVADGPFAARWAAAEAEPGKPLIVTDTVSFLSSLDMTSLREALGGEELIDTFRWLGVTTLGELARLPREALATRFGNPGVIAHRLASGEDRPLEPREGLPELTVEMGFEEPLHTLEAVAFAGRDLAERLLRRLRTAGVAPHTVTITAEPAFGEARARVWRSADPFSERSLSERVWWQLRAWVDSGGVSGGIATLRIEPSDLSAEGRQLSLWGDETSQVETERALARTQAILGPEGVLRARAQGGRMPGERVVWSRWGEPEPPHERDPAAPWPGSTPGPAPALVPPRPDPLEVEWDEGMPSRVRLGSRWEPVLTWSGPWRLTGRWWAGESDCDRYQLVTSAGAILCVVREGRTYLVAVYD